MNSCKNQFVNIIEEHQGIINNLCCLYYNNTEDQHDTRQDIILQLWKSFPSFRAESKISTWIYKVSLNTILSKIKKEKRQLNNTSLDMNTKNENRFKKQANISFDDDIQLLQQIIVTLKEQDKAIIILFLEGYRNKEIAKMLHLTSTNVSTKMNRIKKVLKEKFNQLDYGIG